MIHATIDTFEEEVIKQKGLVLVDFWAQWCGPCQMIAPILAEIDEECPDVKVCKVDVDANMGLAQSYKVVAIPVFDPLSGWRSSGKADRVTVQERSYGYDQKV